MKTKLQATRFGPDALAYHGLDTWLLTTFIALLLLGLTMGFLNDNSVGRSNLANRYKFVFTAGFLCFARCASDICCIEDPGSLMAVAQSANRWFFSAITHYSFVCWRCH